MVVEKQHHELKGRPSTPRLCQLQCRLQDSEPNELISDNDKFFLRLHPCLLCAGSPTPAAMHYLKVPRVTLFYMHHHPKNVLPPVAARYIGIINYHPIVPKLQHVYRNREKGTLWWSVSPAKMTGHKKVIRSWCSRRIRHAFCDALRERGFDRDGRVVVLDESGVVVGKEKGLQGTLDIRMNADLLEATYADIAEQAGFLVDHLRKMSLRGFQTGGYKRKGKMS